MTNVLEGFHRDINLLYRSFKYRTQGSVTFPSYSRYAHYPKIHAPGRLVAPSLDKCKNI